MSLLCISFEIFVSPGGPSAGKTSPKESKKRAKAKSMSGNHKYTVVVGTFLFSYF